MRVFVALVLSCVSVAGLNLRKAEKCQCSFPGDKARAAVARAAANVRARLAEAAAKAGANAAKAAAIVDNIFAKAKANGKADPSAAATEVLSEATPDSSEVVSEKAVEKAVEEPVPVITEPVPAIMTTYLGCKKVPDDLVILKTASGPVFTPDKCAGLCGNEGTHHFLMTSGAGGEITCLCVNEKVWKSESVKGCELANCEGGAICGGDLFKGVFSHYSFCNCGIDG